MCSSVSTAATRPARARAAVSASACRSWPRSSRLTGGRGTLAETSKRTEGDLMSTQPTSQVVRDAIARAVAVVALAGVALVHLLDAPGSFQAAPYKGWLYVALIAGCLGAAGALI